MDQNEDEGRAGGENHGKQDDEVSLCFIEYFCCDVALELVDREEN